MKRKNSSGEDLSPILEKLVESYQDGVAINHIEGHDLPNGQIVLKSLNRLFDIIFPGYFIGGHPVSQNNVNFHIGEQLSHVQLELTGEVKRAFRYACNQGCCEVCNVAERSADAVFALILALPGIREIMKSDVAAGFAGDPSSASQDEVIISYPAIQAITTYRLAHELFKKDVPLIPRLWTEYAHSKTGIDIHPGAEIGSSFFIDHGTGVVIGETCKIGNHVQLYQGVTLGALAPAKGQTIRGVKRHPTIEDNVIIYAGATILGGDTVIGTGSTIGGNVWLTSSVEPNTKVILPKSDLVYLQPKASGRKPIRPDEFSCPAKDLCKADGTIKAEMK